VTSAHASLTTPLEAGVAVIVTVQGLGELVTRLGDLGYEVKGPTLGDAAIAPGPIRSNADLPIGVHDFRSPGTYRIERGADDEFFGWAVGCESWKQEHLPSSQLVCRSEAVDDDVVFHEPDRSRAPLATRGARPCEVAALRMMDRVLQEGAHRDRGYSEGRESGFIAVVESVAAVVDGAVQQIVDLIKEVQLCA